jgi:hypothetical protein
MPVVGAAAAQQAGKDKSSRVAIELGASAFARNDVRVPGDRGTRFDMIDIVGDGAKSFFRINAEWDLRGRQSMGIEVAPFEVSGTGNLSTDTVFADELFSAGAVEGEYEFNVLKISYRYALEPRGDWQWKIGFTGLIRDANIALRQDTISANDDNIGFAPLFHLDAEYRFSGSWRLRFDFDGLAGGPGRAFDVAFKALYDAGENWQVGGGYRLLEGGVDTDSVYNFAWVNYLLLEVGYRF